MIRRDPLNICGLDQNDLWIYYDIINDTIISRGLCNSGVNPSPRVVVAFVWWSTVELFILVVLLTHWGRDRMASIFQTTFSNQLSWMEICTFRLRFHWSLFPGVRLTTFHHWLRLWLGAVQATSHCLKQWWLVYLRIYASPRVNQSTETRHDSLRICLQMSIYLCVNYMYTRWIMVKELQYEDTWFHDSVYIYIYICIYIYVLLSAWIRIEKL